MMMLVPKLVGEASKGEDDSKRSIDRALAPAAVKDHDGGIAQAAVKLIRHGSSAA
jgi:hypothetical protein